MKKYLWDFRGPDGKGTAAHHRIHLEGFATMHNIPFTDYKTGLLAVNEQHHVSFFEVNEPYEQLVTDLLKPHRTENSSKP